MNIFTQGDNKFSEGIEMLITSLCENNKFERNHFYIMQTDISDKNVKKLLKLKSHYDLDITFIKPTGKEFQDSLFKSAPRYYYEGMLRLLMHQYLPKDIDRILYLDSDIIIRKSLKEYYYQDFEGKHIVVHSTRRDGSGNYTYDLEAGLYKLTKIKLPENENIFNNGVFLVNLPLWRKDITEKTYLNCLKANYEDIMLVDQDLMNLVFLGKAKKIIDRNYNCTYYHAIRLPKDYIKYIKENVVILHFVEGIKPWKYSKYLSIPLFRLYMQYYKINHLLSYCYRYSVFYLVKPYQYLYKALKKLSRKKN